MPEIAKNNLLAKKNHEFIWQKIIFFVYWQKSPYKMRRDIKAYEPCKIA